MGDAKQNDTFFHELIAIVFSGNAPGVSQRHVEIDTPSGRTFRYELSEYPISAGMTPDAVLAQAKRIFREKYRYCEWDRKHPHVNVQQEMVDKLAESILVKSELIARYAAHLAHSPRPPAANVYPPRMADGARMEFEGQEYLWNGHEWCDSRYMILPTGMQHRLDAEAAKRRNRACTLSARDAEPGAAADGAPDPTHGIGSGNV